MQMLCRVCLQISKDITNLFSEADESKNIINKLHLCFQITLLRDSRMSDNICSECIRELNNAYNFRIKCLTIDERFKVFYEKKTKARISQINKDDTPRSEEIWDTDILGENYSDSLDDNNINETTVKADLEENKVELNSIPNIFKCNLCNKVLKTKITLLKHYISMHEKRKHIGKVSGYGAARRYHCTSCAYSTPHSQTLVSHIRTHNGERPYICECGKSFTQSSSLAAHRKTHSSTTYFTCSLCGKQFKHAFTMKNHMRVHEAANFSCTICYKSLKSKETLRAHMHRHYKICNYNCEDCGDTFVTSAELHNHRKKHSLEKKIECHLCGYKTHTKKNLIIHLKRHAGHRPFKCDLCNVGFYTRSNLRRHLRVHTGDKPYSCPTCCQKFSYSPSLNKHMKTIHGVDYKWSDCKVTMKNIVNMDENDSKISKETTLK